jgi:hypothetical protein
MMRFVKLKAKRGLRQGCPSVVGVEGLAVDVLG